MIRTPPSGRSVPRRPMLLGVCLLLGAALSIGMLARGSPVIAAPDIDGSDARTMIVTSDSSAYCRTLSGAIDAHGALPREVRELKLEGDGLCNEGRVRGGIARLRRALLVLHKDAPTDDPKPR